MKLLKYSESRCYTDIMLEIKNVMTIFNKKIQNLTEKKSRNFVVCN